MAKITLDRTIRQLVSQGYDLKEGYYKELQQLLNDDSLLSDILLKIVQNDFDFQRTLDALKYIFLSCNLNGDDMKDINLFRGLVNVFFRQTETKDIDAIKEDFSKVLNAFNDKKYVFEYFNYLYNSDLSNKVDSANGYNLSALINYLQKARPYYVDDRALFTSGINLIENIDQGLLEYGEYGDVLEYINKKIKDDKKASGIYDIDQSALEEMDKKIGELNLLVSRLGNLVELAEKSKKSLKETTKECEDSITDVRIKEMKAVKEEALKFLQEYDLLYREAVNKEKENLTNQRDSLLAELDIEIQKKKTMLENAAMSTEQRVAFELSRIRNFSNESLDKLKEFLENDENVKKMLSEANSNDEFMKRLSQIEVISASQGIEMPSMPGIALPTMIVQSDVARVADDKVNYYFDKKIPFVTRFNQLMELKQKDIEENGALYHEKFDDLLTLILENDVPYMYGPSGCGKTFMVQEQLAKLLGTNVISNGYILYEQDVLGYTNSATGNYVPNNFYRCYKFGDTIFLDELDNGTAAATVVLNAFMGEGAAKQYMFPGGEIVKRHPNFRIITAGNTRGTGRTVAHNTRQKIDESVMQRLTPIEIDYDNRIEERILKDYPDWYNFSINFREAIKNTPHDSDEGVNYTGTITTRDVETIRKYKDNKCFDDDKILSYQVIENKDIDTLTCIQDEMERLDEDGKFTTGGKKLLKRYEKLVNKKRGI